MADRRSAGRPGRRLANLITTLFGTDVTRRLGNMIPQSACTMVHEEPSLLRGAYRVILVRKSAGLEGS